MQASNTSWQQRAKPREAILPFSSPEGDLRSAVSSFGFPEPPCNIVFLNTQPTAACVSSSGVFLKEEA